MMTMIIIIIIIITQLYAHYLQLIPATNSVSRVHGSVSVL